MKTPLTAVISTRISIMLKGLQGAPQAFLVTIAVLMTACTTPSPSPAANLEPEYSKSEYSRPEILVETQWLEEHLDDPNLRILDVRPAAQYLEGHIPNAMNLNSSELNIDEPVFGMVGPPQLVEEVLEGLGIGKDTKVVIYDQSKGLWAARVFWIMDYYGHDDLSLLNGGYPKWEKEGRQTTAVVPDIRPGVFQAEADSSKVATKEYILANLESSTIALLDARTPQEYRGEDVLSAKGGHIPGAANVPWTEALTSDNVSVFKSQQELAQIYQSAGFSQGKEVIVYCQTGVRAAHAYFTLRLIGYDNVRTYDGSWEEWGNDPDAPVEK